MTLANLPGMLYNKYCCVPHTNSLQGSTYGYYVYKEQTDMALTSYSKADLTAFYDKCKADYAAYQAQNLKLDMSRGKPSPKQLDLSSALFTCVSDADMKGEAGDYRNYGLLDGIPEGVYAASRNEDGVMYLHQGARLQSCRDAWGNFYSDTMCPIDRGLCVPEGALPALPISRRFPEQLSACVLRLEPYPGLDYASLRLQRYRAVLHGTYHSGTVCVRGADGCSILHLMTLCREAGIPLFIAPGSAAGEIYESTAEIRGKVRFVDGLTQELLYALLTAACSLGLDPVSAITQAGGIIT